MANIKISELNPLLTVEDADVLPIVDNGVTKKVTAAILRSYTQGNSVLLTGAQTVAGIKTFTSQLASTVATGTAPFSVASTTKVTNLNADLLDGLSSADFQATLSGTGIVKSTAGTISYLTDNTANWDTAYNDKINSAAVTGSGTNTLTLTQQDAGTITATWVNGTLIREVRNTTGATLTKGTIVYISGATGNKPTVTKAIASGDSTSAQTFGFIQSDLANNANGYVVVVGDLTGVDTSAFAEGDQLYLSSTVAGAFTSTKQYAPAHLVYVGIVTRSHPTLGQIEVNIQNGYELDELHNVSAQSPSNGDILQFVTSTGLWTKVAGTTTNISEGTNLYFTNARSRSAISESVTGLDYNSTTGVLSTTSGYGIPTTASQATWDTAYNDSIVSAAVTGTTTKTLTLNQQDGGSVTASWSDINTDAVSSVFGRTGAVVAASGDYTTTQVTEGTNLYFTDARARAAISLTTTGTSGAATYSGGVLNIPQYQAALTNPVTGTGTTNYLPKFTGASALGNSLLQENATAIGLGVTPSVWDASFKALQIGSTGILASGGSVTNLGHNYYFDGTNAIYLTTSNASLYQQTTGQHIWYNAPSGTAGNAISFTQAMTLTASGNLLIGTSSNNTGKLQVLGDTYIYKNGEFLASVATNSNQSQFQTWYNSVGATRGYLGYLTNGSNVLSLDNTSGGAISLTGGNVLINTTTDAGYKLDVNGGTRIQGALNTTGFIGVGITPDYAIRAYTTNANAARISIEGTTNFVCNQFTNTGGSMYFGIDDSAGSNFTGTAYKRFLYSGGTSDFGIYTNGLERFLINGSTGAALFSSQLTAKRGLFQGSTGETLTAQGVVGEWVANLRGAASTGNSYGLVVAAGTNASDLSFAIYNQAVTSEYFKVRGDGAATFSSSVTATDAILSNIKPSINFTLSVNPAFSHSIVGENYSSGAAANNYMDFKVANAANTQQLALRLFGTGAAEFSSSVTAGGSVGVGGTNTDSLLTINGTAGTSHERFREGSTTVGFIGGANGIVSGHNGKLALRAEAGLVLSGQGNAADFIITSTGKINMPSLPTSSAGLSAGDIWNDSGTLKIV